MTTIMVTTMIALLLLGFPMMIPLITAAVIGFFMMFNGLDQMDTLIQQMMAGIRPASLIAVPMFILAADIMTRGQSAERLINMVMAFIGHVKGGLAVSTAASCTLFGAVSGSTQATVVAVGSPLRPRMLKAGYSDSFTLALIINSSDIAFLIPPSIGMIIYGVISGTSIGELFIAGIGPGLLILLMFSIYCVLYAVIRDVPTEPKASWRARLSAVRQALWPLGFPVIIRPSFTLGGTGGGIAYNRSEFEELIRRGIDASMIGQVLIDKSLLGWKEYELEVIRDSNDNCIVVCGIENIDPMGVHTGDSITVAPIMTLTDREYQHMRDASFAILRTVGVDTGGANVQFAVNPKTGEAGAPVAAAAPKRLLETAFESLSNQKERRTTSGGWCTRERSRPSGSSTVRAAGRSRSSGKAPSKKTIQRNRSTWSAPSSREASTGWCSHPWTNQPL